jgi:CHAT domain-containing protein
VRGHFVGVRVFIRRHLNARKHGRQKSLIMTHRVFFLLVICAFALPGEHVDTPQEHLDRALRRADLFNWDGAASDFAKAETKFKAGGDRAGELQARIGYVRATADRRLLPVVSAQLEKELEENDLLKSNKRLRMFCFAVKGDIDQEFNAVKMQHDWEAVRALAAELNDKKWQNRALAQLGIAAFYEGDIATATRNIGTAMAGTMQIGDVGGQIRYTVVLGLGYLSGQMYDQAMSYFDKAIQMAATTPDAGSQFLAHESKVRALIGLKKLDEAEKIASEFAVGAVERNHPGPEAQVTVLLGQIALDRGNNSQAKIFLQKARDLGMAAGLRRLVTEPEALLADIYRSEGDLPMAERYSALAAASTQASGDSWGVPARLQALAELQVKEGKFAAADRTYDRADAFVDALIGSVSTVREKTALINASSQLYTQHFSLIVDHFKNVAKAYSVVEQVRGRVTTDLLMAGSRTSPAARTTEQRISALQLELMSAQSMDQVRTVRDQIFVAEESRWTAPGVTILKTEANQRVSLARVQRSLSADALLLQYVLADPKSYCLIISEDQARIVPLNAGSQLARAVSEYVAAVKAKQAATEQGREVYDLLLGAIPEVRNKKQLVIVPDGALHLVPFDALIEPTGHQLIESHDVAYSPSAGSFTLMSEQASQKGQYSRNLLAVGGIPYNSQSLSASGMGNASTRGKDLLKNLPNSELEIDEAKAAMPKGETTILSGQQATEAAFKHADLATYRIIHLAVHGIANEKEPDDAALVFLPSPAQSEDGFLHAAEIVMLNLHTDLVVLSACDTGVGPLQGEEGVANLARAWLLAGSHNVISTLWSVDDNSSVFLMKRFYTHLAEDNRPLLALTLAKRDLLANFGAAALPYFWAGYRFEGPIGAFRPVRITQAQSPLEKRQRTSLATSPRGAQWTDADHRNDANETN